MDQSHFTTIEQIASTHWWYQGRRCILTKILNSLHLPEKCQILEMGCASGENLSWLKQFGDPVGIEPNTWAVQRAKQKNIGTVYQGSLPDHLPEISETFDLITLLDVLEHIENDDLSLLLLKKWITPGGYMVITVPAYSFLWSSLDDINHHKRRYTIHQLKNLLEKNGYSIEYISYFNTFLFPLIYSFRLLDGYFGKAQHSDVTFPHFGNYILKQIFSFESRWIPQKKFSFGVSLAAVVRI
ncbi:MAG: class I SAM-dependent methyltransferase [Candidatus Magnetomorum sp.]|nr:class I SAM-dependent methyltransferase [Candidatus Magnetomorum sp.]